VAYGLTVSLGFGPSKRALQVLGQGNGFTVRLDGGSVGDIAAKIAGDSEAIPNVRVSGAALWKRLAY